jgi:Tfp pilus assembly protein PilF
LIQAVRKHAERAKEGRPGPKLARVYLKRAAAYVKARRSKEALADCDEAIRLNPLDDTAFRARAEVHLSLGEHDKATADFRQADLLRSLPKSVREK